MEGYPIYDNFSGIYDVLIPSFATYSSKKITEFLLGHPLVVHTGSIGSAGIRTKVCIFHFLLQSDSLQNRLGVFHDRVSHGNWTIATASNPLTRGPSFLVPKHNRQQGT